MELDSMLIELHQGGGAEEVLYEEQKGDDKCYGRLIKLNILGKGVTIQ